ncbi:MAG: HPP family protein [Bacillaceae bacterium]
MFVKSIMIPKYRCVIIQHDASLKEGLQILEQHNIDAAPVLKKDKFVGVLTRFRIFENYFTSSLKKEEFLNETTAEEIAKQRYLVLHEVEVFEKAFFLLKNIPLVGVENKEGVFLGIVTRYDMFEEFTKSLGAQRDGIRLTLTCVECEGRIAVLSEIAASYHINIISLSTFDATDKLVRRIVLKIEKSDRTEEFIEKIQHAGFKIIHTSEDKVLV